MRLPSKTGVTSKENNIRQKFNDRLHSLSVARDSQLRLKPHLRAEGQAARENKYCPQGEENFDAAREVLVLVSKVDKASNCK
jgi:hypothetical protein